MDINKVDLLLKYILAAAGQEDYGNREVGPGGTMNSAGAGKGNCPDRAGESERKGS